jgi:hypothetical protein
MRANEPDCDCEEDRPRISSGIFFKGLGDLTTIETGKQVLYDK